MILRLNSVPFGVRAKRNGVPEIQLAERAVGEQSANRGVTTTRHVLSSPFFFFFFSNAGYG